jgi:hypothetical protein
MLLLIILLVLFMLGGLPQLGYHEWGYMPSGTILLIIVLLLLFSGRL